MVVEDAATDLDRVQNFFDAASIDVEPVTALDPTFDEMFVLIIEANTSATERAES